MTIEKWHYTVVISVSVVQPGQELSSEYSLQYYICDARVVEYMYVCLTDQAVHVPSVASCVTSQCKRRPVAADTAGSAVTDGCRDRRLVTVLMRSA